MTTLSGSRGLGVSLPHFDLRLVLGIALMAVAFVGGLAFWNAQRQTTPLVVAAREIMPGHTITQDDLAITDARVVGALASLTMRETDTQAAIGRVAMEPIHAGALVLRPALGTGPNIAPDEVAVTVPVDANAVYPLLRPGDIVAVLATSDKGKPQSQTTTVLERATVYDVAADSTHVSIGSGSTDATGPSGPPANVTVVVPRGDAEAVTHALVDSQLTLVLLQRQGR